MPSDRRTLRRHRLRPEAGFVALVLVFAAACGVQAPRPEPKSETKEPYLLLSLHERRLYLVDNDVKQPPEGYRVAIGRPQWPTPTGHFQVNELVENPDFVAFDFNKPEGHD